MTASILLADILDLCNRWPFLWPMLVGGLWFCLTAPVSWLLDQALPKSDAAWLDLYARKPRLAALAAFLKTSGINLPGAARSIVALFKGGPPPWLLAERPKTQDAIIAALLRLEEEERARVVALFTPTKEDLVAEALAPTNAAATPIPVVVASDPGRSSR